MIISRYSPPGAGLDIRSNTWKPRKCVVCRRRIAKPEAKNQKACHRKACKDELARLRMEKLKRKQKAARLAKNERARIGDIKAIKPLRDPEFLAWLRQQWCIICEFVTGSEAGSGHIEAAHIGVRGLRQRSSDHEAVPLCVRHHRTGKDSHHILGKNFWTHHGLDKLRVLTSLHARYEAERLAA